MFPIALTCIAALFALAYQNRRASATGPSGAMAAVKTASIALLVPAGLLAGAPALVLAGLALGALGDYCLARPGRASFLAGMGAFATGHLAYAAHFAALWRAVAGPDASAGAAFWPVAAAMVALVAIAALWIAPRAGALAWPVRLYTLVIALMALAVAAVPPGALDGRAPLGAALFVASDFILALELFVLRDARAKRIAAKLLWPLYWLGQALILWGTLS